MSENKLCSQRTLKRHAKRRASMILTETSRPQITDTAAAGAAAADTGETFVDAPTNDNWLDASDESDTDRPTVSDRAGNDRSTHRHPI